MTTLRIILYLIIFSALFCYDCNWRYRKESSRIPKSKSPLYPARFGTWLVLLVPGFFVLQALLSASETLFSLFLLRSVMLAISIGFLLLLLPLLRNRLRAESCAGIWGFLFLIFLFSGTLPCWTLSLPFTMPDRQTRSILFFIWLLGFSCVMLFSIISHLLFRHRLLKHSVAVEDPEVLSLWQKRLHIANITKAPIPVRISANTHTPLSIGLFWRTTRLVIPNRAYTAEELSLIFQHELIHISRNDSMVKFSMVFWAAIMWFNPLAWLALYICSQDLELSCDEAVLYGREEASRRQYASLLLKTAPSPYGFTTCLSSAARVLRYRLKHAIHPRKRINGSIFLGILCFILVLGSACTSVRFRPVSINEILFSTADKSKFQINEIFSTVNGTDKNGICADPQALLAYIDTLSLQPTTKTPDVYGFYRLLQINAHTENCSFMLTVGGQYLRVVITTFSFPENDPQRTQTTYYYLENEPDWSVLTGYIIPS